MSITKTEILATGLPLTDHDAIAAALSVGRTKIVTFEVGNGLVLATVGMDAGNALLDVFYNGADFRHVKPLLEQGRLDISSALARASLDGLVGVVDGYTQEHADALKALAEVPDPVSAMQVAQTLELDGE